METDAWASRSYGGQPGGWAYSREACMQIGRNEDVSEQDTGRGNTEIADVGENGIRILEYWDTLRGR